MKPNKDVRGFKDGKQDYRVPFLLTSITDHPYCFDTCPNATTSVAYSEFFSSTIIVAVTCKRWGCRYCGEKKAINLGFRVQLADPNKLITLTTNPKVYETPRMAYEDTRRKLADFSKLIRKEIGSFEYLRILEVTKKGWPHYHLVARSGYIPHSLVSSVWKGLTGAPIVDIRKIKKLENVAKYVMKYLCKQKYIPWTNRRVSWSRKFFPWKVKAQRGLWQLTARRWMNEDPGTVIQSDFLGSVVRKVAADAWLIERPDDLALREKDSIAANRTPCKLPYSDEHC